jgi:PleD family two-component response regulator
LPARHRKPAPRQPPTPDPARLVNDTFGFDAGDEVIIRFSQILETVVADSAEFWEELASISPRTKKVVDAFKKYKAVMEKTGIPYRYS